MRAIILHRSSATYLTNREIPQLTSQNDVLVRVYYAGICRTDFRSPNTHRYWAHRKKEADNLQLYPRLPCRAAWCVLRLFVAHPRQMSKSQARSFHKDKRWLSATIFSNFPFSCSSRRCSFYIIGTLWLLPVVTPFFTRVINEGKRRDCQSIRLRR